MFRIGDQEITRDQMPAMQNWQMNPDHLRQSFQDVLNAKLNTQLQVPQTGIPQQGTKEEGINQWNQ